MNKIKKMNFKNLIIRGQIFTKNKLTKFKFLILNHL